MFKKLDCNKRYHSLTVYEIITTGRLIEFKEIKRAFDFFFNDQINVKKLFLIVCLDFFLILP